jgi:hypothetical protein
MRNDNLVGTLRGLLKKLAKGKMDETIDVSNEELSGLNEAIFIIDRTKAHPKKCMGCGSDNLAMRTKPLTYDYECQECHWRKVIFRGTNYSIVDDLGEVEKLTI